MSLFYERSSSAQFCCSRVKYLAALLVTVFIAEFVGPQHAHAFDVCSDDSRCTHEEMVGYAYEVYVANSLYDQFLEENIANVRSGAGHEDEIDHVYGWHTQPNAVTVTHFWDADAGPFEQSSLGAFDDLLNAGDPFPNGWQKVQHYWSMALGSYAMGDRNRAYHFLGHIAHHLGDNTVPTHAHVSNHDPFSGDDSFEDWMSQGAAAKVIIDNGTVTQFPAEQPGSDLNRVVNGVLTDDRSDLFQPHGVYMPKSGGTDPLRIPTIAGTVETPIQKLYWLLYTTNQIADFFPSDRAEGDVSDPRGWVTEELAFLAGAITRPRSASDLANNDCSSNGITCIGGTGGDFDNNLDGDLGVIREYSYLRGIRAIAGLFRLFRDTVDQKTILTVTIQNVNELVGCSVTNEDCDFYSRVTIGPGSSIDSATFVNEGDVTPDAMNIAPNWRWGRVIASGDLIPVTIEILDEDSPYADGRVKISKQPGTALGLYVDPVKCLQGSAYQGTDAYDVAAFNPISPLVGSVQGNCDTPLTTGVTSDTEDVSDQGVARVQFTLSMTENSPPVINCTPPDGTWRGTNVDIACTATDGASGVGSGLANPADANFNLTTIVAADTERADAETTTRYVCDAKNNCTRAGWAGAYNSYSGYRIDRRAPRIFAPADRTVEATGPMTTLDIGSAIANDFGSGVAQISSDADPSGFAANTTTTVTWSATDNVGNVSTAEQSVTVVDTTAPVLIAPRDITVKAGSEGQFIGGALSMDAVGVVTSSNDAPIMFIPGTTTVTWTAIDAAGNIGTTTQIVTAEESGGGALSFHELLMLAFFAVSLRYLTLRHRRGNKYPARGV